MTFTEIYQAIIPYWGFEINISDGEDQEPGGDEDSDYFFSDSFSKKWKEIEQEIGFDNPYYELMVWTMYQVFHFHAKALFQEGMYIFEPQMIAPREIEEQYFLNLKDRVWQNELANYERV